MLPCDNSDNGKQQLLNTDFLNYNTWDNKNDFFYFLFHNGKYNGQWNSCQRNDNLGNLKSNTHRSNIETFPMTYSPLSQK